MTTQSPSEPNALNFAFPFRDAHGKDIVDEHVFYDWLADEDTGNFAVSSTGMWHGGIHVSAEGAGKHLDLVHGVRCIADGWIVAYLMNRSPVVSQIAAGDGKSALTGHYSSAFTLVRHTLEFPANNTLTFFSLYMHLQSVAEYRQKGLKEPAYWTRSYKITNDANDKPKSDIHHGEPTSDQVGLNIHTKPSDRDYLGILPRGARVRIGERSRDEKWGKLEAIESGPLIPPRVNSAVRPGAETGWVFLGKEHGHYLLTEDVSEAHCGRVIVPQEPIKIGAGELIGHLGRYWLPADPAREHRMVHIEVFCDDTLPRFLSESIKAAEKITDFDKLSLLRIERGTKLYMGHSVDEEGAHAPATGMTQIYGQAALDALPADCKGPVDNDPFNHGKGEPWWKITGADSRYADITGWVRNRQTPAGRVTRESPHAWKDFETVTGADADNPTIFSTVDAWLDHVLCEDKPATSDVGKLKPLACSVYRQLSPRRNEAQAADELRALRQNKWLRFRASRLMPKHRSEWASQSEYQSFFEKVLQRVAKEPYHDAEIERIKRLVWWDEVQKKLKEAKQPFPASPNVFHIHPVGLVSNFGRKADECRCGCCYERKFQVTRLGSNYGPIYWGSRAMEKATVLVDMLSAGDISESERRILVAMSENEGKLDSVQSYDSEIATAGAMQKTINSLGNGEFPAQVAQFKISNESDYIELFEKCGWSVDGTGLTATMYYAHPKLTGGERITGDSLKKIIRNGCSAENFRSMITSAPLAAIVHAITHKSYERLQLMDFINRLRNEVLPAVPKHYSHPVSAYFLSDLGRATALDQSVNRPAYVGRDIGKALDNFFADHPSLSRNPSEWAENHATYETEILEIYGKNREMAKVNGVSVAPTRYSSLKNSLA
ncbi:hypothetical protein FAZ69_17490 [Trinickia terrae]|uniref:Calcium-binding protein n=1 Tax=Trinickia terrae TaxID=2571161 RepID=A0A4U1I447_9BURK|nr:hypothetical protein [Trinickia terrae]TKC88043.1 hypothetical protein FAZ69_17490 [Trinickia terrae]